MDMEFFSMEHEQNFLKFMARAGARPGDRERKALFYILAGDEELACKISRLYDFDDGGITPEARVDLSSGQAALVRVAYNLYNPSQPANLCELWSRMDRGGRALAEAALKIRFA